jgi:hypothetical protein
MADYYPLISRAVANLDSNTEEARRVLYDCARAAQLKHFENLQSPLSTSQLDLEREALEEAINRVENRTIGDAEILPASRGTLADTRQEFLNLREQDEGMSGGKSRREEMQRWTLSTAGGALFSVAFISLSFAVAVYMQGVINVSNHPLQFLRWPFNVALGLGIVVLLPLSRFASTLTVSAVGLLACSFVFAATTGMAAVVATHEYLGTFWTIAGLLGFVVGIVPLGIIAAIMKSDWMTIWLLCAGLSLTFGVRLLATWLRRESTNGGGRHRAQLASWASG